MDLGRQANIDSSSTHTGTVCSNTQRLVLNRSTPPLNGHRALVPPAACFAIVAVTYMRILLNLVNDVNWPKSGCAKVSHFDAQS